MKYKYYGLGRRKSAIAQVYISSFEKKKPRLLDRPESTQGDLASHWSAAASPPTPLGEAPLGLRPVTASTLDNIIINKKKFFDYFQNDPNFIQKIQQILKLGFRRPLYIKVTVSGGGSTGQKDAISLALVRALGPWGFHSIFKKKNLLTQDARKKERKKYGLKKARKAPQYSKR